MAKQVKHKRVSKLGTAFKAGSRLSRSKWKNNRVRVGNKSVSPGIRDKLRKRKIMTVWQDSETGEVFQNPGDEKPFGKEIRPGGVNQYGLKKVKFFKE